MYKAILIVFAGLVLVFGTSIFGYSEAASVPQRVIVTFDHVLNEQARVALASHGQVVRDLALINGAVVLVPSQAAVNQIGALDGVTSVEFDTLVFALDKPAAKPGKGGGGDTTPPPAQTLEWGVDRIDADLAWGTSTGVGVNVAVIDTGIDQDHPDLIANLKGGVNFVSKSPTRPADPAKWNDDNGHGTHVAGIIGAVDNSEGVVGMAHGVNLYGVKVLDRNGSGYLSDVISGIDWAVANGMNVINMSLGSSSDSSALHDAVDAADAAGLVVVAAAGNSGDGDGTTNEVIYPAKYSSVIAVAATASDDSTPYWSSEGAEVELAAPGVDIRSTWNDGAYNTISGTSMASPHAAGAAALVFSVATDINGNGSVNDEVRATLVATADDLGIAGRDNFYGYGLTDAEEAVIGTQTN